MAGQISARNGGRSGALSRAGKRTRTTGVDGKDVSCPRYLYKETVRGHAFRPRKGSRIHAVFDASIHDGGDIEETRGGRGSGEVYSRGDVAGRVLISGESRTLRWREKASNPRSLSRGSKLRRGLPLEGDRFEPTVPGKSDNLLKTALLALSPPR